MANSTDDFYVPVYIINLKERTDRRLHIQKQFYGKPEFKIIWIDAIKHSNGAVGLWKSIIKAVKTAIKNNDDIMIICEDDHIFTNTYSKEYLFRNIIEANRQQAELLSGGIGGFGHAVPVGINRYWIDWFWSTQFIVIFSPLYCKILEYSFQENDTADGVLSILAKNKMTIYPFLSIQKDFGYSDVTISNETKGMIKMLFQQTDDRLSKIHRIFHYFNIIK